MTNAQLRKLLIGGLVALVVIVTAIQISKISFIDVKVGNGQTSQLTYKITNQANQKNTNFNTGSHQYQKRLPKGQYEVIVQQNNQSYFAVVEAKGWFRRSRVQASLVPERARRFVGNKPQTCLNYIGNQLISYTCQDQLSNIKVHVPATATQPTYVSQPANGLAGGFIEGIIHTPKGDYVMLHNAHIGDDEAGHYMYKLGANLTTQDETTLGDLNISKTYSLKAAGDGFYAFDTSLSEVWHYATPTSQPTRLNTAQPKKPKLTQAAFDTSGSSTLLAYNSTKESEVVVTKNNRSRHFNFDKNYANAHFCGQENLICLIANEQLDIYDISKDKPKLQFSVSGVLNLVTTGNNVLAMRKGDILNLDLTARSGSIQYNLGDYKFVNLVPQANGYLLVLTDNKGENIALLVDPTQPDTDSIDKKVARLQTAPNIDDVSAYGNFLFIVPNYGPSPYNEAKQIYEYDPAFIQSKNAEIDRKINDLGINRSHYKIINIGQ